MYIAFKSHEEASSQAREDARFLKPLLEDAKKMVLMKSSLTTQQVNFSSMGMIIPTLPTLTL
jgi:hypothetical protein